MGWIANTVQHALVHWGYLALVIALFGEDAGLPLPGETVLMFAAFLAHKTHKLSLPLLIVIGIAAAVMGDNLGFWVGRKLGPRVLRWLLAKFHMEDDLTAAKDQIRRHGAATVFWARYIFGLRTIAGPVAGALGMEWRKFLVANALGAATWVTAIAVMGYEFANKFQSLLDYFEKASWAIAAGIAGIGYLLWRRAKKQALARKSASGESSQAA
jgi:membrane protein DedA with SNARE-associated domain